VLFPFYLGVTDSTIAGSKSTVAGLLVSTGLDVFGTVFSFKEKSGVKLMKNFLTNYQASIFHIQGNHQLN
jgi:hypothetical protein